LFVDLFVMEQEVELSPDPNEIKSHCYVTREELKEMLARGERGELQVTPWFRLIAETFLFQWWDNLHHLQRCRDHQRIHRM